MPDGQSHDYPPQVGFFHRFKVIQQLFTCSIQRTFFGGVYTCFLQIFLGEVEKSRLISQNLRVNKVSSRFFP